MAVSRSTLRLLRQLRVTIGGEADATVRAITAAWVKAWDTLTPAWKVAIGEIVARTARTGQWPPRWELQRIESLRSALIQSQHSLTVLSRQTGITVTDAAGRMIRLDLDYEPRLIASQLPAAVRPDALVTFAGRVGPGALAAIVARTTGQITSSLKPLTADSYAAMEQALIRGVALGDNPARVAADMLRRVQGAFGWFDGERVHGGLARALNIARTEQLDAYRAASAYGHAANADVLRGWQWSATLDRRTCPSCWSMHGRVFPLDQPGPWDHQSGRCARIPLAKTWAQLRISAPEPDSVMPNARSKFLRLPRAEQDAIFGQTRAQLLRSGQISWDDLATQKGNPGWRPSYVPTPISQLPRQPGFPGAAAAQQAA